MPSTDPASAALHGLYWLTSNLSAERPLLVAVDDAHWADGASLQFLAYLARRLEGLSVALIVAIRDGGQRDWVVALAELASTASRRVVRPGALSSSAVGAILERVSGVAPHAAVTVAVSRATGGNPFLVGELAGGLAADGVPLDSDVSERIGALARRAVSRSIMVRLAGLDSAAGPVLRSVAILGEHAELRHLAALAGVDQRTAAVAVGELVRAGLLHDGLPVAFAHPVLRSTVYADIAAAERADLHARAASSGSHGEPSREPQVTRSSPVSHPARSASCGHIAWRFHSTGSPVSTAASSRYEPWPRCDRASLPSGASRR